MKKVGKQLVILAILVSTQNAYASSLGVLAPIFAPVEKILDAIGGTGIFVALIAAAWGGWKAIDQGGVKEAGKTAIGGMVGGGIVVFAKGIVEAVGFSGAMLP